MKSIDMKEFQPIGGGGNLQLREYCAFTLAEVLITLGVIGVVAAMTMPALINNAKEKQYEAQYKKAQNSLMNAYRLMMANNSAFKVNDLPLFTACNNMTNVACVEAEHKKAFKIAITNDNIDTATLPKNYATQFKSVTSPFKWEDVPNTFATADGMVYGVEADEGLATFSIYTDTNGKKNPNTVKKDLYKFRFTGNKLVDVSDELIGPICSADHLSLCRTQEMCESAPTVIKEGDNICYYTSWISSSCIKTAGALGSTPCNYSIERNGAIKK